jgi:hypothetical protein
MKNYITTSNVKDKYYSYERKVTQNNQAVHLRGVMKKSTI